MTNASHQPEFVADIVGTTLDCIIDNRKRVAVDFELAENGCMEETHCSLKRRITVNACSYEYPLRRRKS